MAGKAKTSTWGGVRVGAGRPRQSISVRQLNAMLRKGRKWAKETGYDVDDFLLAVIGADNEMLQINRVTLKERITCAKIWKDFTMSKVTEQNVNINQHKSPIIGLPPIEGEDPALKVVDGGKK